MRSEEARIAEAVASLTARLDSWGVDEAPAKAHDYVTDMLRAGWRPRALPLPTGPMAANGGTGPTDEYRAARMAALGRTPEPHDTKDTNKETEDA